MVNINSIGDFPNVWAVSDWHFGHDKEFIWGARGYDNVDQMNEDLVAKHNSVVSPYDAVFVLGDTMLGNSEKNIHYIERLNGRVFFFIWGNHDTDKRQELIGNLYNGIVLGYSWFGKISGQPVYLSHYPTLTSNFDFDKKFSARVLNFSGHTHSKDKFEYWPNVIYNVAVDAHDGYPTSIVDAIYETKAKAEMEKENK